MKGYLKRQRYLRLSALIACGLLCGTSAAAAAPLVTAVAADENYTNSDMGTVEGSRVTTEITETSKKGVMQNIGRDASPFNFHQQGKSTLLLRNYTYSTTSPEENLLISPNALDPSKKEASGKLENVPNPHAVAGNDRFIYATGYDLGKISFASKVGNVLNERKADAVDLKTDIEEKCGHSFVSGAAAVHGEALLIDGKNLYVAASVTPEGGYDSYDDGFLLQYEIQANGKLTYKSYTRIGRNTDTVRLNKFNDHILLAAIGGKQTYGSGNPTHTAISIAKLNENGTLANATKQSVTLPTHVKNTGEDMRDIKVLPNGTAYVMTYNLVPAGNALNVHVYQTTVSNLLSDSPADWTEVATGSNVPGWGGKLDAEYYTKRLWLQMGDKLSVYTDGDASAKKTWAAKDFSQKTGYSRFNKTTLIAPDHVTGPLAAVNLTPPAEVGGTAATAAQNPNAVWKTGGDYTDTITTRPSENWTADQLVNIGAGKLGDKKTNVLAAISNISVTRLNLGKFALALQLQVENSVGNPTGVYAGNGKNIIVNGKEVNIITRGREGGNTLTNAVQLDAAKDKDAQITFNAPLNISMTGGLGGNGVAVQKSDRHGEKSYEATKASKIQINGNLKIAGATTGEWGIPLNRENVFSRFNNAGILTQVEQSQVAVSQWSETKPGGNVDLTVYGNGATANAAGSTIRIAEGGSIQVPAGTKYSYYALAAYQGEISMNMGKDGTKPGNGKTGDNIADVKLDGDLFALSTGKLKAALLTDKSYLHGLVDSGGEADLYLKNGAKWINESRNERYYQDIEDQGAGTVTDGKYTPKTRVTHFHGGDTAATHGIIYQKDKQALDIDNYSGHTTVVYEHDAATPTTMRGGDVVVDKAVGDSKDKNVITLFTDNNGVTGGNEETVLDALAGKLTYKSHAEGKLTGKLLLAEGLTASTARKDITFMSNGKGSYVSTAHRTPITTADATAGTYALTKEEQRNLTQAQAGAGFDGKYSALANYNGASVANLTVDLAGHNLTLGMTAGSKDVATIYAGKGTSPTDRSKLTIVDTAGTGELILSGKKEEKSLKKAHTIYADENADIDIQAPVKITSVTAPDRAQAILAMKNASIKMKKLTLSQVNGPGNTLASSKNVFGIGLNGAGTTITVTEDADISGVKGISLYSMAGADNSSKISIGGGRIITPEVSTSNKQYWAVYAASGNVFLNEGKNRDLTVVGNMQAGEKTKTAVIDASFTSATSSWKGAVNRTDASTANLTLMKGATWTHEVQSGILKEDHDFRTSRLTKLTGGDAADKAGIVRQGEKKIEIDNYSGHTRFIFDHDAATPTTIKGGNVTITSAEAGSHVTFSTNPDANINDGNVKDVLNALAHKLTYTNHSEGRLSGSVEVNEGLVSSAAKWAGAISFEANGKGKYDIANTPSQPANEQQKTEFTSQITAGNVNEYVTAKVEKTTGVYTFTKDSTIKSDRFNGAILGDSNPLTINATGKTLTIAAKRSSGFLTGLYHNRAGVIDITAQKLNVKTEGKAKTHGICNIGSGLLRVHGDTFIKVEGGVTDEVAGIEARGTSTTQLDGLTLTQVKSNSNHRAINNTGTGSRVFINMDAAGVLGTSKVDIEGNILTDNTNSASTAKSLTSLALTTADSKLTGTIKAGDKGEVNLYLQNGASWNNEYYGRGMNLDPSNLTKLTGGAAAANAGNVYMKENKALTIANYAGHTNFFFTHHSSTPDRLNGGDVKIEKAEANSHATMITDNPGVTPSNVVDVLSALAKKLYYMDSANSRNLSGTVKVLDGLTSSSAQITDGLGYIDFDETTHQGRYRSTAPVYHDQTIENFTAPITNTATDTVYTNDGVRKPDGSYVFTKDRTTITTSGASAAITNNDTAAKPLSIDMKGHDLKVAASNTAAVTGIAADGKEITVKNAGNLDIAAQSASSAAIAATSGGKVTIDAVADKTVKLRATSGTPANTAVVKASTTGARSSISINGLADIEADAAQTAAALDASASDISIAGGTIKATNGALLARSSGTATAKGRIDINVTRDSAGTVTGADANKTVLEGDLRTENGVVNIGLNTSDSSWKGNSTGEVNLWMNNNALWEGRTGDASHLNMTLLDAGSLWKLTGTSHVKKLAASSTVNRSIFDMRGTALADKLSIDDFSGKAHFLYGNTVTTTATGKTVAVNGGEIHVKRAASGSAITLHTAADGNWNWTTLAAPAEKNLTLGVVKQLANKLYYEGAKTNENNLALTVKVGEGLTTSSAARTFTKADGLTFNKTTGQADFTFTPVPVPPSSTAITASKTLTETYRAEETEPKSTDGSNPVVSALYAGSAAYNKTNPMIVDMNGHDLSVIAKSSNRLARAVNLSPNAAIEIKNEAGKTLTISATNTDTRAATGIYAGSNSVLKVKGPVVIDKVKANNVAVSGITTEGTIGNTSNVLIDGSLTIKKLEGKTTGNGSDGRNLNALYALGGQSTITVTGDADIRDVKGSVLRVAGSTGYEKGGTIHIGGGTLSAAQDADKSKNYRVLTQQTGKVNINMNGTVAGTRKTVLRGDMYAISEDGKKSAEYSGGSLGRYNTTGTLNVALTTQDSSWHGALLYETTTFSRGTGGVTNLKAADTNLWLQNGAQWTNEQLSSAHNTWQGSRVTRFTGGSDATRAGVIFQKDAKPITLDSYSGHTKVLYRHESATPTNIIGGDLTIGKAAAGSAITLSTDSTGLNTASPQAADKNLVSATLNALANKLYYTAYKTGEKNLTGKVEIAEGLTASSASKRLETITFSTTSGQGGYAYTPAVDPPHPGTNPGTNPGTPGTQPGTPGTNPGTPPGTNPSTPKPSPKIEYGDYETKLMSGVKSAMTASTMAWRAEANDLMKRMGDLRLSPQDAGVWARVYRGKATSNKNNANFRMNYSTIQVGYDKKVGDDWRVGVAGSYMSGSSSYAAGNGKNKEGNVGIYGTWSGKDGAYVDLIAKIGRLQNEYTVYNDFGHYVKGDYSMWGGSLSAEYGKRIAMKGGSFVEPQVELIYSHMQGKSYVGSTDYIGMNMYVHQKPFDSFIGRVGFGIGNETERSTCYARVSLYHEFAGDMHTDYSDGYTPKTTVQSGSDTWIGVQLGGTMKLGDCTNLYGNFEKTFGGDIQTAWRMDAGVRWNF